MAETQHAQDWIGCAVGVANRLDLTQFAAGVRPRLHSSITFGLIPLANVRALRTVLMYRHTKDFSAINFLKRNTEMMMNKQSGTNLNALTVWW